MCLSWLNPIYFGWYIRTDLPEHFAENLACYWFWTPLPSVTLSHFPNVPLSTYVSMSSKSSLKIHMSISYMHTHIYIDKEKNMSELKATQLLLQFFPLILSQPVGALTERSLRSSWLTCLPTTPARSDRWRTPTTYWMWPCRLHCRRLSTW